VAPGYLKTLGMPLDQGRDSDEHDAIGLYGVLGYAVTRRTSEIGVRLAMGATAGQIRWMILGQACAVTTAGVITGVVGGLIFQRFISAMLFEAKPTDPDTIATVVGLLLVLGLTAGFFPARRASKMDPTMALRWE
jgi:ABC-type antimicrobial peptide transport system permease subunit